MTPDNNYKICWTKDFSKFELIDYNRMVDQKRAYVIKEVIKERGFLVPILVNQNFMVIDGQHRLEAAKLLNCELSYIQYDMDKDKLPYIISDLNSYAKTWKVEDYFHMWLALNKENYIKLDDLMKKYRISFYLLYTRMISGLFGMGGKMNRNFKRGELTLTASQSESLVKKLDYFTELKNLEKKFEEFGKNFQTALARAVCIKSYNHEYMLMALRENPACILRAKSVGDYLIQLQDEYNMHASRKEKIKFYK